MQRNKKLAGGRHVSCDIRFRAQQIVQRPAVILTGLPRHRQVAAGLGENPACSDADVDRFLAQGPPPERVALQLHAELHVGHGRDLVERDFA
eukprot:1017240-Rhodomonas_salina.3